MARKTVLMVLALLWCAVCGGAEVTVVDTFPPNGANDVDPNTKQLRIRFSEEVSAKSWALVSTHEGVPISTVGAPAFAQGGTLCLWPIQLYPGLTYVASINAEGFMGFKSADDPNVGVTPYLLKFTTAGTKPTGKAAEVTVVSTYPANGSKDVDPLTPSIKVRFSGPVSTTGYAFVTTDLGKEVPTNGRPSFSDGNVLCELPVKLEPKTTYSVSINSEKYNGFRNAKNPDVPTTPYVLTFTTGEGEEASVVFMGPPRGSCGAKGSKLRFELIGSEHIKLYQLQPSGRFRVFGTVKVVQTGQTCKNGWIDKDGNVISTE